MRPDGSLAIVVTWAVKASTASIDSRTIFLPRLGPNAPLAALD